jgi:hypothetical protein
LIDFSDERSFSISTFAGELPEGGEAAAEPDAGLRFGPVTIVSPQFTSVTSSDIRMPSIFYFRIFNAACDKCREAKSSMWQRFI